MSSSESITSFICDTWLTDDDIVSLWEVCEGSRPEGASTEDELIEFARVYLQAAVFKIAGENISEKLLN